MRFPVGGMHRFAYDELSNDEATEIGSFVRAIRASTPLPRQLPPLMRASDLTDEGTPPFDVDLARDHLNTALAPVCPIPPDRMELIPDASASRIEARITVRGRAIALFSRASFSSFASFQVRAIVLSSAGRRGTWHECYGH